MTFDHFLHGCDYNPEQWLAWPQVLQEDERLMPLARMNVMSVGIFAWSALEPEEGKFTFDWLDETFDRLHRLGIKVILATPTGARPPWLAQQYPEVLRVRKDGQRNFFGARHNHCFSSPVFREKVGNLIRKLAERYGNHPALLMWHISNEFAGDCHCELCRANFRKYLQNRYGDLPNLNAKWWSTFWSSVYTDWEQIDPASEFGHWGLHGLRIDWRRFVSHQTIDYYKCELATLKAITPDIPCTTNFHPGGGVDLDYYAFGAEVDIVAWDNYPYWGQHAEGEFPPAVAAAFDFDLMRSVGGGKPWLMMESTPSHANWHGSTAQKPTGLSMLSSLQAIAHGAQSVQYFQWRKSRGNFEKHHGAVVDHVGHEHTRVFREVAATGKALADLQPHFQSRVRAEVGLIYDWNNAFSVPEAMGLRNLQFKEKFGSYREAMIAYYRALIECGVNVDFINPEALDPFSNYKIVIAPFWYMVAETAAAKLTEFVRGGGHLVATYWLGQVNLDDLIHLGGFPGPLRELMGIWSEEWHSVPDFGRAQLKWSEPLHGIGDTCACQQVYEMLHLRGASAVATFADGIYAGSPAITRHAFGKGVARYLGTVLALPELRAFFRNALASAGVAAIVQTELPAGVYASRRCGPAGDLTFVMNFNSTPEKVILPNGESVSLQPYSCHNYTSC